MNKVLLLGKLAAEPELRFTQAGKACLNLRVATTESFTTKDGEFKEFTDWHSVVTWRDAEQLSKQLSVGSMVLVDGKLKTRSYEGKDGGKRYVTEVNAERIELVAAGSVEDKEPWDNSGLPADKQESLPEGWG